MTVPCATCHWPAACPAYRACLQDERRAAIDANRLARSGIRPRPVVTVACVTAGLSPVVSARRSGPSTFSRDAS